MSAIDSTISRISAGIYRHALTNFVVHEAWNVNQLEHANGALAIGLTTGGIVAYAWVVGEDLRSRIRMGGSSLSTLAAVMMQGYGLGEICYAKTTPGLTATDKQNTAAMHIRIGHQGRFANQMTFSEYRIFALVNNCHAGSGFSHGFQVEPTYSTPNTSVLKDGMAVGQYTRGVKVVYQSDPSHKGLINYLTTINSIYPESNRWEGYHPPGHGVVYVRLPVMSWDTFLSELVKTVPDYDKGEVKAKVGPAIARLRAFYPKRAPNMSLTVPLWLNSDGSVSLINPVKGSVYKGAAANSIYGTRYPFICGRVMGEGGLVSSPIMGTRCSTGAILADNATPPGSAIADYTPYSSLVSSNVVKSIDGIKVERFLGGMGNLLDTGEQTRDAGAAMTTSGLMGMLVGTAGWDIDRMPSRVVGGVALSDEQYYGGLTVPASPMINSSELGASSWRYNSAFGPEAALLMFDAALKGGEGKLTWASLSGIDPLLGMHLPPMTEWPTGNGGMTYAGHDLNTSFDWTAYSNPDTSWDNFSTHL